MRGEGIYEENIFSDIYVFFSRGLARQRTFVR